MNKLVLALVLCFSAVLAKADSIVIPFSGSGSSGTIAPGEPWAANLYGTYSWGSPGAGAGELAWTGPVGVITELSIHFSGLPDGVVIEEGTPGKVFPPGRECGGGTRFCSGIYGWASTISADGSTITFDAPAGVTLGPYDYYVNVFFSGDEGATVNFTGDWSSPVPEPGTVWLLGAGLGALGEIVRRRRGR